MESNISIHYLHQRISQYQLCHILHSNEFFIKLYTIMETKQGLLKE